MEDIKNAATEELEVVEVQEESYKSGSVQYIDSREVAEMVGKRHPDLKRDIKRYINQLDMSKIAHIDFFTDSTYRDSENREQSCYLVTLKGCEFIAHKLTGQKGTEFTARYINRFHEMQDELTGGSEIAANHMGRILEILEMQSQKINELESRLDSSTVHCGNPFTLTDFSERKEKLDSLVSEVARLYKLGKSKVLHYLYRTIEENLKASVDGIKSFYKFETGNEISTFETVIQNNQLYIEAVRLCEETIERKKVFG